MPRPSALFVPPIMLDRAVSTPLAVQIREQIAAGIARADYAGRHLPSTRTLAGLLGVSRNTVLAAYDDLAADGLIEGQRGSRMLICGPAKRGLQAMDPQRVLREAQFPERTVTVTDPDGNPIDIVY